MNAKKCKQIRKNLRARGVDPRETRYVIKKSGTAALANGCGRKSYKITKTNVVRWVYSDEMRNT